MVKERVPEKGDIVWLSFNSQAGHEQAGHRPALVMSPKTYNQITSLALLCPITSKAKGYPFEVLLTRPSTIQGAVLSDQIKSLDWRARGARFECRAPRKVLGEALEKVKILLG